MKTIFSKEYVITNKGCYNTEQVEALPFDTNNEITIFKLLEVLPFKDFGWWLRNCKMTKKQIVIISILCAESVLHIYEKEYPNDSRVRDCIEATKKYIKGECHLDELIKKKSAAYAADAAAYAAAYAYADAAADAAAYAAAAYAADAAEAADAYAATYWVKRYEKLKEKA